MNNTGSVLLVEDDANIQRINRRILEREGFYVYCAACLQEAYEILNEHTPDVLVLDIMLPDGSGLAFCEKIRPKTTIPVLFLTALDEKNEIIQGLVAGGNDYITKPFSLMILRARVERMLARMAQDKGLTYEKDGYRFVFEQMYFTVEGQEVTLSKTEQKLLRILIEHQGQTLTREQLVDRIWSDGAQYVEENALSVTVGRLRKKLEQTGKKNPIQTVYGLGYVWER